MKEPPLTQAEVRVLWQTLVCNPEFLASVFFRWPRKADTPRRLARDIQRLWNLQPQILKSVNPEDIKTVRWGWRWIGKRLARLVSNPKTAVELLRKFAVELQRPQRTDDDRRFRNAYFEELYREREPPTYKTINKKFAAAGIRRSERNLQRINKARLHLRMRDRGRPRKK
jgi:hypothetical protein